MRVLMLVATPVVGDVRVVREASALAEVGHEVHVVGRDVPSGGTVGPGVVLHGATGGSGLRGSRARSPVPPRGLRGAARWLLLPEHRRRTFGRWAREAGRVAGRLDVDVVHAHDYTALALGARLARDRGVPLVYDAHELWAERHRAARPTPLADRVERARERRFGGEAAVVLTVGDALAARLRHDHGWADVRVVRNSFPAPDAGDVLASPPVAAVYAGRLGPGRDLETVAAASTRTSLPLRLVGPRDPTWLAGFDARGAEVADAVDPVLVDGMLRAAGAALVTLEDGWGNHAVALPNKLFQAVAAGVPVVASDVGELARTVRQHGIGVVYRPGDPASLSAAIEKVRTDHAALVAAVRRARAAFGWEADRDRLLGAYRDLEERRSAAARRTRGGVPA